MSNVLAGLALLITLPGSLELLVLTIAALLPRRPGPEAESVRLAVVIPAHNEAATIGRAVKSLQPLGPGAGGAEIIVVADNCSDDTAERARAAGARVLVRDDLERRGKPFALELAFRTLFGDAVVAPADDEPTDAAPPSGPPAPHDAAPVPEDAPDAVAILDADTVAGADFVAQVRRELAAGADAVQVRYGVLNPHASVRTTLLHVAFMAFNHLRPRGRDRLGLSAGLLGNGFALRREVLARVPFRSRSITEDLHYHIELVSAGLRVRFLDTTEVLADMPTSRAGQATQRARWEGGRLNLARSLVPRLAKRVLKGEGRLLEPLIDLVTLPLAFHVLLLMCAVFLFQTTQTAWFLALGGLGIVALHVGVAMRLGGAGARELSVLALAPLYMVWKLTRALSIARASGGDAEWVRTARDVEDDDADASR